MSGLDSRNRPLKRGRQLTGHAMRAVSIAEGVSYALRLGAEIRLARESVEVSADELAAALGVNTRTVHGWESGRCRPSVANLWRIARALGMRVESLLPEAA